MPTGEYCLVDKRGKVIETNGEDGKLKPLTSRSISQLEAICKERFNGKPEIKELYGRSNGWGLGAGMYIYGDLPKNYFSNN